MPPSCEIVESEGVDECDGVFGPVDDTGGESDDIDDVDESSERDPIEDPELEDELEYEEDPWGVVRDATGDNPGRDAPAHVAFPGRPVVPFDRLRARCPNASSEGAQGGAIHWICSPAQGPTVVVQYLRK